MKSSASIGSQTKVRDPDIQLQVNRSCLQHGSVAGCMANPWLAESGTCAKVVSTECRDQLWHAYVQTHAQQHWHHFNVNRCKSAGVTWSYLHHLSPRHTAIKVCKPIMHRLCWAASYPPVQLPQQTPTSEQSPDSAELLAWCCCSYWLVTRL